VVETADVYEALLVFFQTATYPGVTYDPATRERLVGAVVLPGSIELNELSSDFAPARNHRDDLRDHSGWLWSAILTFGVEVDFSTVRKALQKVIHINKGRIAIQRIRYTHPPRQDPNTGSRAEFVLNVLVQPL